MKTPSDALKVIEGQYSSLIMRFLRAFCGCCCTNSQNEWLFERAPEPTDINWENLEASTIERICRGSISYIMTLFTVCMTTFIIVGINEAKKSYLRENEKKAQSMTDMGTVKFLSAIASVCVAIVNVILNIIIRRFTLFERHETQTSLNTSVAFKLTVARFLNSSLVILIVNWNNQKRWYNGGDLVYEVTILITILVFMNPILYLLDPWGLLKKYKKMK